MTTQTYQCKLPILSFLCGPCVLGGKNTKRTQNRSATAQAVRFPALPARLYDYRNPNGGSRRSAPVSKQTQLGQHNHEKRNEPKPVFVDSWVLAFLGPCIEFTKRTQNSKQLIYGLHLSRFLLPLYCDCRHVLSFI
jgi:hypothetical protein